MKVAMIFEGLNVENISSVEELFLVQAQLKTMDEGFQNFNLDTPEWISDKLTEVGHEITMRVKGELARKLRAAKARRSALRTADEKRNDLDREIADLETKLA